MPESRIRFVAGRPLIDINNTVYPPFAYTTYFDECGKWSDFSDIGCRMFFVNVSFTDLPINNVTGFSPFRKGVFETVCPDYSDFDKTVNEIISVCPDAFIFPRINIAMPRRWIKENIHETVETVNGGNRESLFSDVFRKDASGLLSELVSHIRASSYADSVAGYQLCGGTTQEWMHHDLCGSFSESGIQKFRKWACDKYGITDMKILSKNDLYKNEFFDETVKYCEFCNEQTADTVEFFARQLKGFINNEQIVGVFYGYNAFVSNPLFGLHGLGRIIDSPYIDFFSSPCGYEGNRKLGIDWGDMLPSESLKLHGKLYFVECDIRTHLTNRMQDSRPGEYPDDIYQQTDSNGHKTVWSGPDTSELSISALRKTFAHQLTKKSGIWWFDMWGGWYHDNELLSEIRKMRSVFEDIIKKDNTGYPEAETVLFIDEKAYANVADGSVLRHCVNAVKETLGCCGIPFDICMTEDAPEVLHRYKTSVFTAPVPSESGRNAVELCKRLNKPYLSVSEEKHYFNTKELSDFLTGAGVHRFTFDNCVVYCSGGVLGVHTAQKGHIKIILPEKFIVKNLFGEYLYEEITDLVIIEAEQYSTYIFELQRIKDNL